MKAGLPFSILVVDDDEDDRMIIDDAFKEISYESEVKKFINGKTLLTYLGNIDTSLYPSLIVLDNTLPELEAEDILSTLKSEDSYKSIPVVIYTTLLSPNKKQQLLSMGAYACFEKENTMREVVEIAKEFKKIAESEKERQSTAGQSKEIGV
jgi:DNA-binding NtrC family response regulator